MWTAILSRKGDNHKNIKLNRETSNRNALFLRSSQSIIMKEKTRIEHRCFFVRSISLRKIASEIRRFIRKNKLNCWISSKREFFAHGICHAWKWRTFCQNVIIVSRVYIIRAHDITINTNNNSLGKRTFIKSILYLQSIFSNSAEFIYIHRVLPVARNLSCQSLKRKHQLNNLLKKQQL